MCEVHCLSLSSVCWNTLLAPIQLTSALSTETQGITLIQMQIKPHWFCWWNGLQYFQHWKTDRKRTASTWDNISDLMSVLISFTEIKNSFLLYSRRMIVETAVLWALIIVMCSTGVLSLPRRSPWIQFITQCSYLSPQTATIRISACWMLKSGAPLWRPKLVSVYLRGSCWFISVLTLNNGVRHTYSEDWIVQVSIRSANT